MLGRFDCVEWFCGVGCGLLVGGDVDLLLLVCY